MRLRRVLCILLLLGSVLLWQNFSIQAESCEVLCPQLPEAFADLRIVQLSDLHGREFGDGNERLLKRVAGEAPDLICITGDLFEKTEDLSMLEPLLRGLCSIAPTYYVTGNHEWQVKGLSDILQEMQQLGVCVLRNSYVLLQREGEVLVLAGVDDPCGPYDQKSPQSLVEEIRQKEGEDVFILMLAHRNDTIEQWAELGVDLVLTGHCHGGIVRLPYVGGVFGPQRSLFPEYDAGLYEREGTQLYVSRGLGYSRIKLRLFNRPHLPVLTLKGK